MLRSYIASGLDGAGSPSAYNLALDDGIRGCPAYEEVVQPSMRDFDVKKYQGRWYELGFHDWTQFSEVYGTTLDIELSQDGQRWVDDFAVKGPAPLVAPLSWDKSPVANGAHYFLYGKVDTARPGVLQVRGRPCVLQRMRSPLRWRSCADPYSAPRCPSPRRSRALA